MSKTTRIKTKADEMYADFGYRLIAWIIDLVIIFVISWILTILLFWSLYTLVFLIINVLAAIIGFLYFFLLESFNKGQTLGKMIFKLRTVNDESLQLAPINDYMLNSILRGHWLLCFIDFLIGIIKSAEDPNKRLRIMQHVSRTVVIREN